MNYNVLDINKSSILVILKHQKFHLFKIRLVRVLNEVRGLETCELLIERITTHFIFLMNAIFCTCEILETDDT